MLDAYEATLKARGFKSDPAQRAAAQRLQGLYSELVASRPPGAGTIRKLLSRPKQPRSVYFWGGVGRGKSFLMDCFYDSVPYQRKRRVHFHAFMQEVQNDLKKPQQRA
jgi:cell division protein ZapE